MNPTILAVASQVERTSSSASQSLPKCSDGPLTVNPVQPLTSGVWQGWGDPGRRSTISAIQLDNADVITFHGYAAPAEFEAASLEGSLRCSGNPVHRSTGAVPGNTVEESCRLLSG